MIDKLGEVGMPVTHDDMNISNIEFIMTMSVLQIFKCQTTITLQTRLQRNGHLMNMISQVIQKFLNNIKKTIVHMMMLRNVSKKKLGKIH